MEVLSSLSGLSYTLPHLYSQIAQHGWEMRSLKFDKTGNRFVAKAKAPHGEELEAWGPSDQLAVANLLHRIVANRGVRSKISMWSHTFTDQMPAIAEAYSKAPLYEPKAAAAFMELAHDSEQRAKAITEHLEVTLSNNPEPYKDIDALSDDVRKRRKIEISQVGTEHPIWSPDQVIAYRLVHDVLGHVASGGGFDWQGENQAFAAHAAIIPVEAQKALFSESIGHAAYAGYYRAYGPQKVALFPEFMDPAQKGENPHDGFRGVHPSQSFAPVARPRVKPVAALRGPGDLDPVIRVESSQRVSQSLTDPNEGWSSNFAPLPQNAYLHYEDPTTGKPDPLQSGQVMDNAALINTEWAQLNQEDPSDLARMKQAVVNAFRVVLLSPRKDLRWNAIHYQDIANIPGDEDDPSVYWRRLEKRRQEWNVQRHGEDARFAHMPYYQQWKALENLIYQRNPQAGFEAAVKEAEDFLHRMQTRIQEQVMAEDSDKPEENQRHMYQIELETNKRLSAWLKTYIKEHQMGLDFEASAGEQMGFDLGDIDTPEVETPDKSKYGAWMGTHLQAIAQISEHVDEILKAALFDVHERDGTGHHFRASVLQLGVPGVGPKVCSFAWLLLQPLASQLATIDTHMMDVLGHHYEKDMNNRDYFKFERELAAGRDAAGYGHVPLGAFQWGMWDYKRTGPGTHQDHSAMRVLDPQPYGSIDWATKAQNLKGDAWLSQGPQWWRDTQPARDQVASEWDSQVAPYVKRDQIPYSQVMPEVLSKTATSMLTPHFVHPFTGEIIPGQPGQTLMQHLTQNLGMTTPQVWQKIQDEHVFKA